MPPTVSIIIPCYNEALTIEELLASIHRQTYPTDRMEVVVADGGSQDGTRERIEAFSKDHPELRLWLVDNPGRAIPAALNKAIEHARGEVIIRLDAHSQPQREYVERCMQTLKRTRAANVGGVWLIRPGYDTWIGRAIAAAAAHPFGAGDARYRLSGAEGPVDTVPFGAFRREWIDRVGRFSEDLLANEDYEYNVRIRRRGGTVWFDPAIRSVYLARGTLRELARQYARYGFWKARMLLRYPRTIRWRQALPPLFVLTTLILLAGSWLSALAGNVLAVEWGAYALALTFGGLIEAVRRRDLALLAGIPLALLTMHLSWGGAFWWGLLTGIGGGKGDRQS